MSHSPYIMPDGRPLGQFLQDTQVEYSRGTRKGSQKTRRGRKAEREGGWTHRTVYKATPLGDTTEEIDESAKLGRDRRRRYLNEKILRDMAGVLTVSDMEALFKPVPFGETGHVSPLTQVTGPDILPIWDLFRNVDEDKQNRTLQKWEEHLKMQKGGREGEEASTSGSAETSGLTALRSWAKIPRKAREALKRTSPAFIEELEQPILMFSEQGDDAALELELGDSYQRLMIHGLATYHDLQSHTSSSGLTYVRQRPATENSTWSISPISCADIVFALAANPPGGLTASVLDAQWRRMQYGSDAGSSVD